MEGCGSFYAVGGDRLLTNRLAVMDMWAGEAGVVFNVFARTRIAVLQAEGDKKPKTE